jgi:hypothetical protein
LILDISDNDCEEYIDILDKIMLEGRDELWLLNFRAPLYKLFCGAPDNAKFLKSLERLLNTSSGDIHSDIQDTINEFHGNPPTKYTLDFYARIRTSHLRD